MDLEKATTEEIERETIKDIKREVKNDKYGWREAFDRLLSIIIIKRKARIIKRKARTESLEQINKEIGETIEILKNEWEKTSDDILDLENTAEYEAGYERGLKRARKIITE